ncbi:MAG: TIGR01212 family radical SAM protein [Cetobacterium sp.]|uniref:TIGR01212 family radical SAM protein n=1 Tax=Cetobacterium sp. TaxID=2071632 RepID=UPI002FC73C37
MNNRRFFSLNDYFKDKFNEKIYKVSLDGGFTCPNRDGKVATGGCLFCSESGSGDFAGNKTESINSQIEQQLNLIKDKFPTGKVIAYFQNFTNTYGEIKHLRKIFYEALAHERVIGIAIGTRPDCLPDEVLDLLSEINEKYFLWIELGLQTIDEKVIKIINRAYSTDVYIDAMKKLNLRNIKVVTHLILGLPEESKEGTFNAALLVAREKSWGIKLHSLHILKTTPLARYYEKQKFKVLTKEEYIEMIVDIIEVLPKDMVIHRLTGDGKSEDVIEPLWSLNKRDVLNRIEKELKNRNTHQGKKE